jgi:hypothetical protein
MQRCEVSFLLSEKIFTLLQAAWQTLLIWVSSSSSDVLYQLYFKNGLIMWAAFEMNNG